MNDKVSEKINYSGQSIESCPFKLCLRNSDNPTVSDCYYEKPGNKLPSLIFRRPDNLNKIKFVVVSQEPGVSARKKYKNIEDMKRFWCEELNKSELPASRSSPIYLMKEIFPHFDIYHDQIYWTHALKCIPWKTDKQIERDWMFCAPYCSERLKEELKASSEEELVIITFGAYALTLILNIVKERKSLCEIVKLKDWFDINPVPYIKEFAYGSPSDAESKKSLRIYPFYHPAAYDLPSGYDTIKKNMINKINAEISSSQKTI